MTRDEAIAAWQQAATLRKQWEAREHELRLFIASTVFGYNHAVEASLKTGNHDIELDNSRKLRLVTATDTKIKDGERLRYTMQWLRDNTAVVYPKPLVSFKPTLSMTTYNAVPQNMRDYLSPDITVTNKLPTLEIIEPKKMKIMPVETTVDQQGIKCVVYGGSGLGKTRMTLTCPRPLYVSGERGGLSLRGSAVPTVVVETLAQLVEVHSWALNSNEAKNFDTLVVDSFSEIGENVLRVAKSGTKDGRKAHNDAFELVVDKVFNAFRDLPQKHVYAICKERYDEDSISKIKQFKPSMPNGNLIRETPYKFDYVFRLFQYLDMQTQQTSTWLQCNADTTAVAKDRSGALDKFEQPNLGALFARQ